MTTGNIGLLFFFNFIHQLNKRINEKVNNITDEERQNGETIQVKIVASDVETSS